MKKLKNHTVTVRARREVVYREFAYFPGECFNVTPTDAVALHRDGCVSLTLPMDRPTVGAKVITPDNDLKPFHDAASALTNLGPLTPAAEVAESTTPDEPSATEPSTPRRRRRTYQRRDLVAEEPVGQS